MDVHCDSLVTLETMIRMPRVIEARSQRLKTEGNNVSLPSSAIHQRVSSAR